MSCLGNALGTLEGAAQSSGAPKAVGALALYSPGAKMVRTKREIRQMMSAMTAAIRGGEPKPCLGEPRKLLDQLQSVLDGTATPRDLLPKSAKPDETQYQVYGWLTGQPWAQLDAYVPHRGLRGCVITKKNGCTTIRKVMGDGTLQESRAGANPAEVAAWLAENDYVQTGALIKREGDGTGEGEWAVCYLRPWDSPETLSGVKALLGDAKEIVPATLAYYPAEDKIATNRRRDRIQKDRYANFGSQRDFGVMELPTQATRLRAYGLT
jgi:hypothetical protein